MTVSISLIYLFFFVAFFFVAVLQNILRARKRGGKSGFRQMTGCSRSRFVYHLLKGSTKDASEREPGARFWLCSRFMLIFYLSATWRHRRPTGGTPGRTEPAPGTGGHGHVFAMKRASFVNRKKKTIKSHLEIFLIFFTGFKVEF